MDERVRKLVAQAATLRAAFELVGDAVFVVDRRLGRVVDANPAACQTCAVGRGQLFGRRWSDLARRFDEISLSNVDDRLMVAVVRAPADAALRHAHSRDALTGLANRDALAERVTADGQQDARDRLALLFIDLDGFKQVNDTWGHVAGDCVLRMVAERLSDHVRPGDLVVRYGGDEFLVVVEGMSRRRDLERLARRIARAISRPHAINGHEIVLTASIGIAKRKSHGGTIEALVAEADRAMYQAKSRKRAIAAPLAASQSLAVSYAV